MQSLIYSRGNRCGFSRLYSFANHLDICLGLLHYFTSICKPKLDRKGVTMLRNVACLLALLASASGTVYCQSGEVKKYVIESIAGSTGYLKAPVIRIEHGNPFLGAEDATNVIDGHVRYKARIPGAGMFENDAESTDAFQFRQQAELTIKSRDDKNDRRSTVRFFDRGTPFTIHKTRFKKKGKVIWTDMTFSSGTKSRIRFYFDDSHYTPQDVWAALQIVTSPTPIDATVQISEGMTVEQVIAVKGKAKSKISIGSKTILTYSDVKLIFQEGKLVDVE